MYPNEIHEQFIALRAQGKSIRTISAEMNIAKSTLAIWSRQYDSIIEDTRKEELADVLDELSTSKLQRVKALSKCFKKLENYLVRSEAIRGDVNLYQLLIRYDQHLNRELPNVGAPPKQDFEIPEYGHGVMRPLRNSNRTAPNKPAATKPEPAEV